MIARLIESAHTTLNFLNRIGEFLPQIGLRLLLAWEFNESGLEKLHGSNWFGDIQDAFPFPFNLVPVSISWQISLWAELLGSAGLVMGLATRFWALFLLIIDLVAWSSVHAGNGYNVCDNGFKLPLIYFLLLLPLLFNGPGKLSLDHIVKTRFGNKCKSGHI